MAVIVSLPRNGVNSISENNFRCNLHQWLYAIRRELPGKKIRVSRIGLPQRVNKRWRDLAGVVSMRMAVDAVSPVHSRQRIMTATFWILHRQ